MDYTNQINNTISNELHDATDEIIRYAETQMGISYYDLVAYAYNNDKEEWLETFKKQSSRNVIRLYVRDKRKTDKVPYTHSIGASIQLLNEAKDAYKMRHGIQDDNTL